MFIHLTTLTISRRLISSFSGCNEYHSVHRRMCTDCLWMPALSSLSPHLWESVFTSCYQEGLSSLSQSFCLIYLSSEKPPMSFLSFYPGKIAAVVPILALFSCSQIYTKGYLNGLNRNLLFQIQTFPFRIIRSCIVSLGDYQSIMEYPHKYWLLSIFIWMGSSY